MSDIKTIESTKYNIYDEVHQCIYFVEILHLIEIKSINYTIIQIEKVQASNISWKFRGE